MELACRRYFVAVWMAVVRCLGVGVLGVYSVLTTVECARLLKTYPSVVKVNAIS